MFRNSRWGKPDERGSPAGPHFVSEQSVFWKTEFEWTSPSRRIRSPQASYFANAGYGSLFLYCFSFLASAAPHNHHKINSMRTALPTLWEQHIVYPHPWFKINRKRHLNEVWTQSYGPSPDSQNGRNPIWQQELWKEHRTLTGEVGQGEVRRVRFNFRCKWLCGKPTGRCCLEFWYVWWLCCGHKQQGHIVKKDADPISPDSVVFISSG